MKRGVCNHTATFTWIPMLPHMLIQWRKSSLSSSVMFPEIINSHGHFGSLVDIMVCHLTPSSGRRH